MAITANKKFWTEFIDIYHSLPCLWNTKDENYNNRESRGAARNKLVEKLQEVEPDANHDSVKRKINTFRSNFNREVRKLSQTKVEQGAEAYCPTLWYFDQLSFLLYQEKYVSLEDYDEEKTLMEVTTNDASADAFHTESGNNEIIIQPQSSNSLHNHQTNILKTEKTNESEKNVNCKTTRSGFNKRSKTRFKSRDPYNSHLKGNLLASILSDEAAIYGQSWACGFRKLSPQQKLYAKKAIDEILILGQLNALKLQTIPRNTNFLEVVSDRE